MLPWLELALGIALGLVLYLPLDRKDLAEVTWIFTAIVGAARIAYVAELHRTVRPIHELLDSLGMRQHRDGTLRSLITLHDRIVAPELQILREDVMQTAMKSMNSLANDMTSELLQPAQYYEWLNIMLQSSQRDSTVRAVSMMLESEWDDSPPEARFLHSNVEAAKRGVTISRLFVMPETRLRLFSSTSKVAAVHSQRRTPLLSGYVMAREALETLDLDLLRGLGDGFVVFDARVALIDIMLPPDRARGQVTTNPTKVTALLRAFDQAILHARRLSAS